MNIQKIAKLWNDTSVSNKKLVKRLGYDSFEQLYDKMRRKGNRDLKKVRRSRTIDPTKTPQPVETAQSVEESATSSIVEVVQQCCGVSISVVFNHIASGSIEKKTLIIETEGTTPEAIAEELKTSVKSIINKYSLGSVLMVDLETNETFKPKKIKEKYRDGATYKLRPVVRAG